MIRKHKKFRRPKHKFDSERIKEEETIVKKYGLKNKKEIWKAKAKLDIIRNQAKKLIDADEEKQEIFLSKLKNQGLNVQTTADVLALTEEDILKRRLQTIVLKKNLATTSKGARQLITHKHILVKDKVVNIPSYLVQIDEENTIKKSLKPKKIEEVGKKPAEKSLEVEQKEPEEAKQIEEAPKENIENNDEISENKNDEKQMPRRGHLEEVAE